jgi:hypothetical protein
VCGYLIEHPPGLVGAGNRRTDRVITVDERYSRPPPVSDQEAPHHLEGGATTVRTIPSVPGSSGVASAADAVVGVTMTSSRFINR